MVNWTIVTPNTKSFIEKSFRSLDLDSRRVTYDSHELNNIFGMLVSEDLHSQILALDIVAGMKVDYIEQLIGKQVSSCLSLTQASSIKHDWAELTEIMLICYPAVAVNHIKGTHLNDNLESVALSGFQTWNNIVGCTQPTFTIAGNPQFTHSIAGISK